MRRRYNIKKKKGGASKATKGRTWSNRRRERMKGSTVTWP
jgi:hypothetical protein